MSDMEINKPGMFHRVGDFIKREITGEEKEGEKEGTWSNSTLDYVTKGGVTGGLLGAGMGAAAHFAGKDKTMTYKYEVPVMEQKEIGQIPQNHVAADKVMGDPKFVQPDGKPVKGMGYKVMGEVPKRGLLGGIQMEEKTGEVTAQGHSLVASVLGGAVIGTVAGVVAGIALKIINGFIHPAQSQEPWSRSAPPAWDNSGGAPQPWSQSSPEWKNAAPPEWSNSQPGWNNSTPPAWKNSSSPQPWSQSAPAWTNTHSKAPWSNVHSNYSDVHSNYSNIHSNYSNIHSNYSDTHSNYHDTHSNYSDIHSNYGNAHSNYGNSHSNYSNTHSNYSNSHSNSWDRNISY